MSYEPKPIDSLDTIAIWFSNPTEILDTTHINSLTLKPQYLYLYVYKFIEHAKINNMSWDLFLETLNKYNIFIPENMILNLNNIYNNYILIKRKKLISDEVLYLSKLFKKWHLDICRSQIQIHQGYPLNDPKKGRPRIQWKVCMYKYCNDNFASTNNLRKHLISLSNHIPYFHYSHEEAINYLGLNKEIIKDKQIKKCASKLCGIDFETSDLLCNHYKELGIIPFWKSDDIINIPNNTYYLLNNMPNIYFEKDCLICQGTNPSVLYLPCRHCICCVGCHIYMIKYRKNCPMCNQQIINAIPF